MGSRFELLPGGGVRPSLCFDRPAAAGWYFVIGKKEGCSGSWVFVRLVAGVWRVWGDWLQVDEDGVGPWLMLAGYSGRERLGVPWDLVASECGVIGWVGPFMLRGGPSAVVARPDSQMWSVVGGVAFGQCGLLRGSAGGWYRLWLPELRCFVWVFRMGATGSKEEAEGRFEYESWRDSRCGVAGLAASMLRAGRGPIGWGPIGVRIR